MLPTQYTSSMCEHCAPLVREEFTTYEDFVAFEKELEAKSVDGTFIRVVNSDEVSETSLQAMYQCTHCGTDWVLSTPENSWRGYFLPSTETPQQNTNFVFEANSNKRSPGCGCCLAMIFLLIALILYIIYSFFDFIFDLIF